MATPTPPPPPVTLDLEWEGDLRFAGRAEKYCSVWHSLREDIAFTTSFEIASAGSLG